MLGQESYGVVGFYVTLGSILSVLDLGLPVTVNRLVAQSLAKSAHGQTMAAIVWGTVSMFWVQALLIAILIGALSWWIATDWLRLGNLSANYVREAVALAALAIAVRWPITIYQAILMGAGRIALTNQTTVAATLLTTGGALAVLHWVAPDLRLMFGWFALAGLIHVAWLHMCARPLARGRGFTGSTFGELKSFLVASAPVGITGILGLLLTHSDRLILSRAVALDAFGHYVLATLVASAIYAAVTPISNALYPRFSILAARGEALELCRLYRASCHGLAAVLFPLAMLLCVSGESIVLLWTRNEAVSIAVALILRFLVVGSALHGIMFITYAVSMALGLQVLVLKLNALTLALALPLISLFAINWGAPGAALASLLVQLAYFLASAFTTHRYVMPGISWRWFLVDVGIPAGISAAVGLLALIATASVARSPALPVWYGLASVAACWGCMLAASSRLRQLCRETSRWIRPSVT